MKIFIIQSQSILNVFLYSRAYTQTNNYVRVSLVIYIYIYIYIYKQVFFLNLQMFWLGGIKQEYFLSWASELTNVLTVLTWWYKTRI